MAREKSPELLVTVARSTWNLEMTEPWTCRMVISSKRDGSLLPKPSWGPVVRPCSLVSRCVLVFTVSFIFFVSFPDKIVEICASGSGFLVYSMTTRVFEILGILNLFFTR